MRVTGDLKTSEIPKKNRIIPDIVYCFSKMNHYYDVSSQAPGSLIKQPKIYAADFVLRNDILL